MMENCFGPLEALAPSGGKNSPSSCSRCFGALGAFCLNAGKTSSSSSSKCFGAMEISGPKEGNNSPAASSKCSCLEAFAPSGGSSSSSSNECELPEEMVETIIARIPFPAIFKSRCLSRKWNDNLSISRGEPGQKVFQMQVSSVSDRWPSFCPVYVVEGTILGYHSQTQKWCKICMHAMTGKHLVSTSLCQRLRVYPIPALHFAGALICQLLTVKDGCQAIVSNVLTGSSSYLPISPPGPKSIGPSVTAVIGECSMFKATANGYEVFLVHTLIDEALAGTPQYSLSLYIQHYSSETKKWAEKSVGFDPHLSYEQCIYLVKCCCFTNGSVYLLFFHEKYVHGLQFPGTMRNGFGFEMTRTSLSLWSYGIDSGQWAMYQITPSILADYDVMQAYEVTSAVVKCGSRILLLDIKGGRSTTLIGGFWTTMVQFRVSELDLLTRQLEVVSRSPVIQVPSTTGTVSMKRATRFAADDRQVFVSFTMAMAHSIHVYDADKKSWSSFPSPDGEIRSLCGAQAWVETPFSPGAQTFSSV